MFLYAKTVLLYSVMFDVLTTNSNTWTAKNLLFFYLFILFYLLRIDKSRQMRD